MLLKLLNKEKYRIYNAHISDTGKETLFEHTDLVCEYFKDLIKAHNLEKVIESLISELIKSYPENDRKKSSEFIKSIFYAVPEFHDIGKLNPNFQHDKMGNETFKKIKISFGSDHSKVGAFLFIQNFLTQANDSKFSDDAKIFNLFILFTFSFSIAKHHAPKIEYNHKYSFDEKFINDVFKFIECDILQIFNKDVQLFDKNTQLNIVDKFNNAILLKVKKLFKANPFSLFALLKLSYSLLTASDYLATTHFMNGWKKKFNDFGVLNFELKKKIIYNIMNSKSYNKKVFNELQNYKFEFPEKFSNENLNKLRQNLAVEIIKGIQNNVNKNLFYIEAPTGSGKTNLSILALAEFIKNDIDNNQNNITKVFYIFPFTTLITQTFKVLKETLGLNDEEIVQIHSKTGFIQKEHDDKYGTEKLNIIDYQFLNYPICLMSHVRFFDILKSNKKTINYLMHRLANSVIIIDELQSYPPKEWDKVIYFINSYATYFNIKFILMSATLPKIDKLLSDDAKNLNIERQKFVFLTQNKDKYFKNPNFKDRVKFDFSMLNNSDFDKSNKEVFLDNLWLKVLKESKKYLEESNNKRVHTIIEFIFKRTATKFINLIKSKSDNSFFDEIFLISGTILEPRRKEIINKIKSDKYKKKNILVITTQVVEAGMDIDMDLGFKDSSLLDSDEQLAGRINRNVNKSMCKLFIFDYDEAKMIYGKDYRFKKLQEELKDKYFDILKNKNFDLLYDSVMNYKNKFNKQLDYADNLPAYITSIKNLKFDLIEKDFRLIHDAFQDVTIFVPLKIPINIPNSNEKNFSDNELNFLREKNKYNNENYVDGEKVWELYCNIIENNEKNFTYQKIQMIILQGLMSKFSFSIGLFSKEMNNIINSGHCEQKYGFYKLHNVDEVYDYETGIKDLKFEDIFFL